MRNPKAFIRNCLFTFLNQCECASQLRRGGLSYKNVLNRVRERQQIERDIRAGKSTFRIGTLSVQCLNPSSFTTLYDEIFFQQAYYFQAKRAAPRIIDCGANIGLTLMYFKQLYPQSIVTGFEPHPAAHAMAKSNVENNNFTGVDLIQAAISNHDGHAELKFVEGEIMASTLTNRLDERGCKADSTRVVTARLRPWLQERVDFLKLDIEGAEGVVLADCQDLLSNVENIFVEGHWTRGQADNSAAGIVGALEKAGFNVLILSTEGNRSNSFQPLLNVRPITSFIVYGTR